MADTENDLGINLANSVELASSLLDQLGEAFGELEAHKVVASNNLLWKDIEGYFRNLESDLKKNFDDLQAKEKIFSERESHNNMLLAEREAAVVVKEQDVVDGVQELKDAAVAAISEARAISAPESLEADNVGLTNGNKVSSYVDDENTELDAQEGSSPRTPGENVDTAAFEANPRAELIQFCELMDSQGILKFVMENHKNPSSVCKEVSVALGSATEPARLVLDALEGFFPPNDLTQQAENNDAALHGMRRSCLILMEALSVFLSKDDSAFDAFITPDSKRQATSIAYEWNLNLAGSNADATNGISLEAEGFLRLLATFRIFSEFDEAELCKYVLAVSHHRQATELCHSLKLSQKIPGLVETLLSSGRQIDAVHFIHAFQLSESIPSVPILKLYLKELRRRTQGNGSAALQSDYNARELEALRAVIECVEEYKLEAEYPLDTLYRRVGQLDKSAKNDRKRTNETGKQQQQQQQQPLHKKPRPDSRSRPQRARGSGGGRNGPPSSSGRRGVPSRGARQGPSGGRQGPPAARVTTTYVALPERYNPAVPSVYSYPVAAQSPYAPQATDPRLYHYPQVQNDQARKTYSAVAPTYGTYIQQSHQPYM